MCNPNSSIFFQSLTLGKHLRFIVCSLRTCIIIFIIIIVVNIFVLCSLFYALLHALRPCPMPQAHVPSPCFLPMHHVPCPERHDHVLRFPIYVSCFLLRVLRSSSMLHAKCPMLHALWPRRMSMFPVPSFIFHAPCFMLQSHVLFHALWSKPHTPGSMLMFHHSFGS